MGVIGDSISAYAQPLFDETDGSLEEMQRAMTIAQLCWNLALLPDNECAVEIDKVQSSFQMNDIEFEDFKRTIIVPMIQRHRDMFPQMRQNKSMVSPNVQDEPQDHPATTLSTKKYPGTGRNEPCPCNSGKKYKRCCGR